MKAFKLWFGGVQFKREDGLVLSVNMGFGGYNDNHMPPEFPEAATDVHYETNTVEMAVMDGNIEGRPFVTQQYVTDYNAIHGMDLDSDDDVMGYVSAEDAFPFIAWFLAPNL